MMKQQAKRFLRCLWCIGIIVVCCCTASAVMANDQAESNTDTQKVQEAQKTQDTQDSKDTQETTLDKEALDALNAMSKYLRTLDTFEVKSTFYRDEVLMSGQKILAGGTSSLTVKRPNKLFAHVNFDEREQSFFMYFDGKNLSLHNNVNKFYTTIPAPGTLKDLVLKTFFEKGIELPLQDLFLWGTEAAKNSEITTAMVVGTTTMNGVSCTHYAYRQEGVDWQLWIQEGEQPLPQQLVITTTSDEAQPQYSARLHWNLKPFVPDAMFAFAPPRGSHAVDFLPESEDSKK